MKKIMIRNPEWYKVGYFLTSQDTDEVLVIKAIEVRHAGLSFPLYYLRCERAPNNVGSGCFATWCCRNWFYLLVFVWLVNPVKRIPKNMD